MTPRIPTEEERAELVDVVVENTYINPSPEEIEMTRESVDNLWIAVFDDYITDGPGYAGKLMVVVWGGSPEFVESYVWHREIVAGQENLPIQMAEKTEPKLVLVRKEQ